MKTAFLFKIIFYLTTTAVIAQQVDLVRDINNSSNNYGSNPYYTVALGSSVVFVATDPLTGSELWISNGTSSGTTLIKDIYPGGFGSGVYGLTNIGGTIYFYANDGVNGAELWKTNGTAAGTVLVKDINPGPGSSYPREFTQLGTTIYFNAYTEAEGYELWQTDGTADGTALAQDIDTGSGSSNPSNFEALGTTALIFRAYTPATGYELYSYDGTTLAMKDIVTGTGGSSPSQLVYNASLGLIFFRAFDSNGWELWKTNGNFSTGTSMIELESGYAANPNYITSQGSYVYFQGYKSTTGYELYKSDGATTGLVGTELVSTTGSSYPSNLTATGGGGLFFWAYDATNGYALRYTTGSSITMISNTPGMYLNYIIANPSSANVYFSAHTSTHGYELWKATSTTASLIKDIVTGTGSSSPYYLVFNGAIFFSANDGVKGTELWYSDGLEANTVLVKDINSATDSNISGSIPTPSGFLISANDGVNGQELWKTDGTTDGTTLVKDILSGVGGSNPQFLGKVGTDYYFSAYDNTNGQELWKTDGTADGTILVKDIEPGISGSYPYIGAAMGSYLYFIAYTATYGYELWKTDGTELGTSLVMDIYPGNYGSYPYYLTVIGTNLFFAADDGTNGNELWKSDGSTASVVKNINLSGSSYPYNLIAANGSLFFTADDGVNGSELWKSDGTSAGTTSPKDIYSGTGSSYPSNLVAVGSTAFFIANDGANGNELWKSDGTLEGTVLVKDIYTGTNNSSYPQSLTAVGEKLYFTAFEPAIGSELWSTDGTTEGTVLIKDIREGTASSNPRNLTDVNGSLYFAATDGITGNLVYKSNGTTAFKATSAGEAYDYVNWSANSFMYFNGKVIFSANTNTYGNEPLSVMAEPLTQPTSLNFTGKTASSISGSFTAALDAPAGYIVLRKAGSPPTDLPIDGTPYVAGATIGTSTVAAIGAGTSFTDNFAASLTPSIHYYAVFSYNYDGVANIYRPYSALQGNSKPLAAEPAAQPTGFTTSNITTTSFSVAFTAASGAPAGYLALRKAGTVTPSEIPEDGVGYTAGASIGTSTIAYAGSDISFGESGLSAGESYSYAIFSYNGDTDTYNYLTAAPLIATAATLPAEPSAQPTSLVFSSVASDGLSGSFTAASPAPDGYIILRSAVSPVDEPLDGTSYIAGETVGASTVVSVGAGIDFTTSSLTAETEYYFAVYSFNGSGSLVNYLTASPLTGARSTLAAEPAAQPAGFIYSSPTTTSYTVEFTDANGPPDGYIVLRVPGSTPPADVPVDGTEYAAGGTLGSSTIVHVGSAIVFSETALSSASSYSYAIFSYNGSTGTHNYLTSSPLTGTGMTLADEPSSQPTAFAYSSVAENSYTITYAEAGGLPDGYIVLRAAGSTPPVDVPLDGNEYTEGDAIGGSSVAYVGSAATFDETGLNAESNYSYAVFSYNGSTATYNYLTASPLTGTATTLATEPSGQPSLFDYSSVTTTSYSVSFTAAGGAPDGYIVLRVPGSTPPADVPVDGNEYTAGGAIGGSTVVHTGPTTSFGETALSSASSYSYAIFAYNGSTGTHNYLTSSPLTGTGITLAAQPSSQPTAFAYSAVAASSYTVTFAEAGGLPDGYIVLRVAGSTPPVDVPLDGNEYTAGDAIGGSSVAYVGSAATFNETGLNAESNYSYAVFSYNGSTATYNYLTASPLTGTATTLATEPSGQPTLFDYSSVTATSYSVSFTAAAGPPDGYIVLRVPGSTPPADVPVDGNEYAAGGTLGSSTVVYVGSAATFEESALDAESNYSYAVFSFNGSAGTFNYLLQFPLTGMATTVAGQPLSQPTSLIFSSVESTELSLSWTAASGNPDGYLVVRKTGSAPTGTPIDGSAYALGDPLSDGTVVYAGSATVADDAGLSPATNYFYQVFSYNGSGTTSNYLTAAPLGNNRTTLDAEPVAQPTSLVFSNVDLRSLSVSFTASSSGPVSGYIVIRNAGSAPTGVPEDGITYSVGSEVNSGTGAVAYVGGNTSFDESSLSSQTVYHYAVYAYNDASGPVNYLTVSPLTANIATLTADGTPPVVNNTTPTTVASGLSAKISATITDGESDVASVKLEFRSISGNKAYTTIEMTPTGSDTWESRAITTNEIGEIGLEFKITATNTQNLSNVPSSFSTLVTFADSDLGYSAFGNLETNYRIISVPVKLANPKVAAVFEALGPYDDTKYRILHFENGKNTELNGNSLIDLGKGYWFIAKTQATINTGPGTAANVSPDQPFSTNLAEGWNQIGNPYIFNVLWNDVLAASGNISLKLRTYDGAFRDASTLNKFEGGFVFANAATTLTFPTAKNSSVNGRIATGNEPLKNPLDHAEWDVVFTLQNGLFTNDLTGVGMRPAAKAGYDKYDDFTIPRLHRYLELNHSKSFLQTPYSKDVVPTTENYVWEFSVDSNIGGATELRWDNSYFGNNAKGITLLDVSQQAVVDMRAQNSYWFNGSSRKFKVIFGDPDFVRENTLTDRLTISNVFPNPTSSDVTIGFTTPDYQGKANVEVKLHTMIGQTVTHLFNGELSSGYHELTWDGTDNTGSRAAQGVYLIEVRMGRQTHVEKLVVK